MRALLFDGSLRLASDVPRPSRQPGEALINVHLAGICGTDLEILEGYKCFRGVLGHEFVGSVVESDGGTLNGTRVCGEINIWCGDCTYCSMGLLTHCARRTVLGILDKQGCFAEYITLPERNLHVVPDSLDDEEAVFAEPVAAAYEILQQVSIADIESVAVLGDGRLGAICALVLKSAGLNPLVIGRHEEKLRVIQRCGLRVCGKDDVRPSAVDLVLEATGSSTGLAEAMRLVRPRGIVVMKSTTTAPSCVDISYAVVNELTLVGSRCGPFPIALDALVKRTVDVNPLITDVYSLDDGIAAFDRAREPGALKVLLKI